MVGPQRAQCSTAGWLRRTKDTTRQVIVLDPWRGTGLGHIVLGMTNFLELALASDRAVRFAFCAPRRLNEHFAPPPPHVRRRAL
mmetsp:Transcript_30917/g.91198  ORF Transcript_30917/g.91198 Transcript_30917/m.91198 type:complete len:84 (+) Transcript_30917:197-448(+)